MQVIAMFTIDLSIKDLKARERNMIKAFFSMNNHQVATPEMMLEEARSYIIFFRESSGKISAYIGIHLLVTGRRLFYSHSSNPFSEQEIGSVEEEARNFADGLGAMIDEVDFTKMDHQEKMRWIDTQDIFTSPLEKPEAPASVQPPMPAPQEPVPTQQAAPHPPSPQPQAIPETQPAPAQPAQQPAPPQVSPAQPIPPAQNIQQPVPAVPQQPAPEPPPVQEAAPAIPEPAVTAPEPQAKARRQKAPKKQDEEETQEERETVAPLSSAERARLEILQSAIKAGIVKAPKPTMKKDIQSATGVVSRDREALARLLTSF